MKLDNLKNEDKAWVDFRDRFAAVYDDLNYASPLQATLMRASHRLLEKKITQQDHFSKAIEIGAGTGEHLQFVRHTFDKYVLTDIDEKTLAVAKGKLRDRFSDNVAYELQKADGLHYADDSFDRLIASHILEHIYKPHLALKEWIRVIKSGGMLSILMPTDPGIAWRLGRHLGPRKNAIAQGIAYDYVMAREHVNPCNNLIAILRHYLPNPTEPWWPFPILSIDLNLFYSFNAIVRK